MSGFDLPSAFPDLHMDISVNKNSMTKQGVRLGQYQRKAVFDKEFRLKFFTSNSLLSGAIEVSS